MASSSRPGADRHQRMLLDIINQPGNDACADCHARAPRWASHNLGIFICMNCASVHRKIGTHITKVKSVTMDAWTKEQVDTMRQIGNIKSNQIYNPDELRNPPPLNSEDSQRSSELEKYIRAKYEKKQFVRSPSARPKSTSISSSPVPPPRAQSTPLVTSNYIPPGKPSLAQHPISPPSSFKPAASSPFPSSRNFTSPTLPTSAAPQPSLPTLPSHPVWQDLASLQTPSGELPASPMQIVPPVQQSLPIQSTGFSNYGSLSPQGAPYLPSSISTPSSFDNRSVSLPTTLSANVPSNSFSGINSSLLPPFSQSPGLQSVNPFNTFQPMSNQLQTGQNFSGGFSQGPSELSMGSLQPGFNPSPFPSQTINNPSPFPPIQNQFQTQGQFGANFPFQNPPPVQQQQQFNPGFQPQGAFQPQQQTQTNPFMSNPTMWGPQQTGGPMGGWS